MNINRGPDGKFLPWGGQIAAWLPALLDEMPSSGLEDCLISAAEWCKRRAATTMERRAKNIRDTIEFEQEAQRAKRDLDYELARYRILLKALAELREFQ